VLDSLRQPLETGTISVARANAHVTFPARVQPVRHVDSKSEAQEGNPFDCGGMHASILDELYG